MLIIVDSDYNGLSRRAAALVALQIRKKPASVLGLATGATPRGLYAELIRLHAEGLDFSRVITFNLDEYFGISRDNPHSFFQQIHRDFLNHVNILPENVHVPDGSVRKGLNNYCDQYEKNIADAGGIDLQILGIGNTGHIGFNEPTSSLASRTRLKTLTQETIDQNQQSFENDRVPEVALTMGIGTILDAQRILLIASGAQKAEAIAKAIEGPITAAVTASALQLHRDVTVLLDEEAAGNLIHRRYYDRVVHLTSRITPERLGIAPNEE